MSPSAPGKSRLSGLPALGALSSGKHFVDIASQFRALAHRAVTRCGSAMRTQPLRELFVQRIVILD